MPVRKNLSGNDPLLLTYILRGRTPSSFASISDPVVERMTPNEENMELRNNASLHLAQQNYRSGGHDLIIGQSSSTRSPINIYIGHWGDGVE